MTKNHNLTFRPHHFLCTLGFQGKGYSPDFVQNYQKIKDNLTDDTEILVVSYTDSICAPCPHRREKTCTKETFIQSLDQRHAYALSIKDGNRLTWREAKQRLKNLTVKDHHKMCDGCSWRDLGVCEKALTDLHNES